MRVVLSRVPPAAWDRLRKPAAELKRGFQLGLLLFAGKNTTEGVKIMDRTLRHFATVGGVPASPSLRASGSAGPSSTNRF